MGRPEEKKQENRPLKIIDFAQYFVIIASMAEFEPKSVYNREVPDDVQREGTLEDSALRKALFNVWERTSKRIKRNPKRPKPLKQGHGIHL